MEFAHRLEEHDLGNALGGEGEAIGQVASIHQHQYIYRRQEGLQDRPLPMQPATP